MREAASTSPRTPSVVALLLASIGLCAVASAAALNGVSSNALSAGAAPVLSCDSDGFTVTHTTAGTTVTGITVSGIHADCATGELTVVLTDGVDALVATGGPVTVPGGGGSVVVTPSPAPDETAFTNHRVRIAGP